MTYEDFTEKCVEDLKIIQDKFSEDFHFEQYDEWFYNQSTGLLTLSTENEEINFKYVSVGTFSLKSNTWKWAWDNEHTLDSVKENIHLVKEYGQKFDFPKLTQGCFDSDEIEAWEFTAIAAKIVGGIGAYRPKSENLMIFMILLEFIDAETAQSIKDSYVECKNHEYQRRAFVCKHLNHTDKVGFEEAFETFEGMELLEDDDLQAWCNECEKVRQKEGEWTDDAMEFSNIKLICEKCYFEIKELNTGKR